MSQARVFQCPRCQEFIATDAKTCRFCSTPIDSDSAQSAADTQEQENKRYRRHQYARHMMLGGGLCALGVLITIGTYGLASSSRGGGHYVITYGLMLSGAGDFLYGLVGWLGELK
jgi:predicted nucleic acid-binding Zn ribbon protein